METISVNDERISGESDSARIQNAVALAKQTGINAVSIPKFTADGRDRWRIEKAIRLPSEITVYFDECTLYTPKEVACNFFCNETYGTAEETLPEKETHDIRLIGHGNAVLDGGEYNGLSESNAGKDGRPSIRENCMLIFTNARNIEIKNLQIKRQRWWAMCFSYCTRVRISNIDFEGDFSYVDENGERRTDRTARNEPECYIKNADGIDLRNGCSFFTIENITGRTEDDTIALTTLQGSFAEKFVAGKDNDIHDVTIKNVKTDCLACENVRLLCADGNQVYNILIDGIFDAAPENALYAAHCAVKINDSYYKKQRISRLGEMRNISVNNVFSRAEKAAVEFQQTAKNVSVKNVFVSNPAAKAVAHSDGYGKVFWGNDGPFEYENIYILGVYYSGEAAFEYAVDFRGASVKNLIVEGLGKKQ